MENQTVRTDLLGTIDASRVLGISTERVRQLANDGTIRCFKTSIGRLFRAEDVAELAEKRQAGTRRKR